ncbi:M16 family metallopeptidase [Novosphingobium aquimarinum]|uniref:M16 family metallopeptidase n=1 Tax=Novosphingobium aquimarinum TaxID=2682494 RepID=UPI0012EB7908|nr:insulinase family protein [Novosphingobium aquimarinum]
MRSFRLAWLGLCLVLWSATGIAQDAAPDRSTEEPDWAFETSDIPLDPGYRFGRLANGMRYVVRSNGTPEGTALIRMVIEAGSFDERDDEQGFAHFVEHMAFNGSTHVPEGEMIPLLERDGLAFGADTNASTGFERTTYKLNLPRTDPRLLQTALMLMRETASELTIAPDAVERERGVVLAEMRDRNTWRYRDLVANTKFQYPDSRFATRFPIGVPETVAAATADALRAFYERTYEPANTTLVVVGDFDPDLVEREIRARFADWRGQTPRPQPMAGPIDPQDKDRVAIYVDPAVSERTIVQRLSPYRDLPDSIANRRQKMLAGIGYSIVNRRLQRLSRQPNPPFRGAGFGTGDVFEAARATRLIVDTVDRKWRRGLIAAAREYRRALLYGFDNAEVAEQVANIRTSIENAAASRDTRSNATLVQAIENLLEDGTVPSPPASVLERFEALAPQITPETVMAALVADAEPIEDPLIRLRTRFAPAGGEDALRAAWDEAMEAAIDQERSTNLAGFAYTDFGAPGVVVSDRREPVLNIREVVFANGVMLNLKRTRLEEDRVRISLSLDGGDKLDTRENPLATAMVSYLDEGGLGKHSTDELQSILAGRTVSVNFGVSESSFDARALTTPRDLQMQLQLLAAAVSDPGYRLEGEIAYRQQMNTYFLRKDATPASALGAALGGILSDGDPRFTLQDVDAYRARTFAQLRDDISERLSRGAIEIGIVGDIDEDQAIALVAATFGALPAREPAFRSYDQQPQRPFSADRKPRVVYHDGPADQALLRLTWPTRDDSDADEALRLQLLERIVRVELTDTLREALGKAYSPSASSALSRYWSGYGTFAISASVDVGEVAATRAAIDETIAALRSSPLPADVVRRARAPLAEAYCNALKSNGGWLSLVDRAQSEPERIARYMSASKRLDAITPAEIQTLALRYLDPRAALEILVLPREPAASDAD